MSDLFRSEAVRAQRPQLVGNIILDRHWSTTVAVWLLCAVVAAAVYAFFTLGFARKEVVSGEILPVDGLVEVGVAQGGVLTELRVGEGDEVAAGDVLAVVSAERSTAAGGAQARIGAGLQAQRQTLREELARLERQVRQQAAGHAELRTSLAALADQLEREITLQHRRVAVAAESEQQIRTLQRAQEAPRALLLQREGELIEQRARLEELRRERADVQARLRQARLDADEAAARLARERHALARDLATLQQSDAENDARGALLVRAPRSGTVAALAARVGQGVDPGAVLAMLVPAAARMEAVLYAPTRAIGLLQPGAAIELRYDAFPFERFGAFQGTLRQVSLAPLPPAEAARAAAVAGRELGGVPVYRLRVELAQQGVPADGRTVPLRAGMRLSATLVLERRRLVQWAFEPLAGLTGGAQ
jgi:membrane fusion protein